jgi:hypothetical protein
MKYSLHPLIPFLAIILQLATQFISYVPKLISLKASVSKLNSTTLWVWVSLSLMLRPTVSRTVCPGIKHSSEAYDQIFITFWQFRFCFCGMPSLTRWRVCLLYMLLDLASAVLLGSESLCSRDHILLSHIWYFPFRRLLRLVGSRWRYSTPPPHGFHYTMLLNAS